MPGAIGSIHAPGRSWPRLNAAVEQGDMQTFSLLLF